MAGCRNPSRILRNPYFDQQRCQKSLYAEARELNEKRQAEEMARQIEDAKAVLTAAETDAE